MGIASSTLSYEFLHQKVTKTDLPIELLQYFKYEDNEDPEHNITIQELIDIFKMKTDVYLSYSLGYHKKDYDLVKNMEDHLKNKELKIWFDEEKIPICNHQMISTALMNTSCVVIFITQGN